MVLSLNADECYNVTFCPQGTSMRTRIQLYASGHNQARIIATKIYNPKNIVKIEKCK